MSAVSSSCVIPYFRRIVGPTAFTVLLAPPSGESWSRANSGVPVIALAGDPARPATIYAGVDNKPDMYVINADGSGEREFSPGEGPF